MSSEWIFRTPKIGSCLPSFRRYLLPGHKDEKSLSGFFGTILTAIRTFNRDRFSRLNARSVRPVVSESVIRFFSGISPEPVYPQLINKK